MKHGNFLNSLIKLFLTNKQKTKVANRKHKDWSSRYDYTTYPGSVIIREARCLDCGISEKEVGNKKRHQFTV